MSEDTIVLVDGSYCLFRAYHSVPPLKSRGGQPTGAILGVLRLLKQLQRELRPRYLAIVFDARGKNFRHEWYPEYKANRPPMPEDLQRQIEPLHALIRAQDIPLLSVSGVEADDVIGTLAKRANAQDINAIIVSGDKDFAQLVGDRITLLHPQHRTTKPMDADAVEEKFGVPPTAIVDYLSLTGDKVDNIPGIPGVGPKTAARWLCQHGNLKTLLSLEADLLGKAGKNLKANRDQIPLFMDLIRLKTDVPLDREPTDLEPGPGQEDRLRELYARWGFRSLLSELSAKQRQNTNSGHDREGVHHEIIENSEQLASRLQGMAHAKLLALSVQGDNLDAQSARLLGVALAIRTGQSIYLPLPQAAEETHEREAILVALKTLLEDERLPKVAHDLKYDQCLLARYGIQLRGSCHDTMLESYIVNNVLAARHDMESLVDTWLDREASHHRAQEKIRRPLSNAMRRTLIAPRGRGDSATDQEQRSLCAAEQADIVLSLHEALHPELGKSESPQHALYQDMELPISDVLCRMEQNGVLIDAEQLALQSRVLHEKMQQLQQSAYEEARGSFNIASTKELRAVLFEKMQLKTSKKTPKGQLSTDESVLRDLSSEGHLLPQLILEFRRLEKLCATYVDKLPKQINPDTGRVHTCYHQAVVISGRLSSSNPNLQNIPVRTEEGKKIREAFISPPGRILLVADYSQIELRIMAHLAEDEGLLRCLANGGDVHRQTASEVFGGTAESVSAAQRRAAKAINFGLVYGMSAFGLARQLGVTQDKAEAYQRQYFTRYPGVRRYMQNLCEAAREKGYVETLFHRRLYIPELQAKDPVQRKYAERTAGNLPMQGTAADIIKRAMIAIDAWLSETGSDTKMIMQVHDELVFEVAESEIDTVHQGIKRLMTGVTTLKVPLEVHTAWGDHWAAAR